MLRPSPPPTPPGWSQLAMRHQTIHGIVSCMNYDKVSHTSGWTLIRAQFHGTAYHRLLRLRSPVNRTNLWVASAKFRGKQSHEFGPRCVSIALSLWTMYISIPTSPSPSVTPGPLTSPSPPSGHFFGGRVTSLSLPQPASLSLSKSPPLSSYLHVHNYTRFFTAQIMDPVSVYTDTESNNQESQLLHRKFNFLNCLNLICVGRMKLGTSFMTNYNDRRQGLNLKIYFLCRRLNVSKLKWKWYLKFKPCWDALYLVMWLYCQVSEAAQFMKIFFFYISKCFSFLDATVVHEDESPTGVSLFIV